MNGSMCDSLLPDLAPGTCLLCCVPKARTTAVVDAFLLGGDGGVVVVATDAPPGRLRARLGDHGLANEAIGIVSCRIEGEDDRTVSVASPRSLTRMGVAFSKVSAMVDGAGPLRLAFDTLSTVVMAMDDDRAVFRFCHALTGRVKALDAVGLFVIDPTLHDERTLRTLGAAFDGRMDVAEDAGDRTFRVLGLPGVASEWRPL